MKTEANELLSLTFQPLYMERKLFMSFTAGLAFDLASGKPAEPSVAFAAAVGSMAPGDCLDLGVPKAEAEWLLAGSVFVHGGAMSDRAAASAKVGESSRRFLIKAREPFSSMELTWGSTWGNDEENPDGQRRGDADKAMVSDEAQPYGTPACMGPRGAWPCRMKRMGSYDDKWLKNNWPGVPDDFDWSFYNLSQPAQRLPHGLNGGERIILSNLNKDFPLIETNVPKAETVFCFETKDGEVRKKPSPDTLWLFPGEMVGLILWHAAVECVDEAGAGIDLVRAELNIGGLPAEAPVPHVAVPPAAAVPEAAAEISALGNVGAAASVGTAAAAGAAAVAGTALAAEGLRVNVPSAPGAPTTDSTPPSTENASVSNGLPSEAVFNAEMQNELDDSLPEINAALVSAGFPPMSDEQVAETREHIKRISKVLSDANAKAEAAAAKEPNLEESLKNAGVPDEQIKAVKQAIDIPVPDPADFGDQAAWGGAVDAYAEKFCATLGTGEAVKSSVKKVLKSLPIGEKKSSSPPSNADCVSSLINVGMEPAAAARFVAALEEDLPTDSKALLDYASKLEEAAGFPKDSVRGRVASVQNKLSEAGVDMGGGTSAAAQSPASAPAQTEARKDAGSDAAAPAEARKAAVSDAARDKAAELSLDKIPLSAASVASFIAAGGSLAGAKLDGAELSGINLSGLDLKGASFAGAKLDGARFDGADLSSVSLAAASLKGASFVRADLRGAALASACLDDCDFSEALLSEADVSDASLCGAYIAKADAKGLAAKGADLSRVRVMESDMSGADFSGAKLVRADFHNSGANGADFTNADASGSTFCWGTDARNCKFAGAKLSGANWTRCDASGSDFSGTEAGGASFTDCVLSSSRWDGALARGGDFSRSILEGASMQGIDLFRGSLREARLSGTDLSLSNLFGADLCRMFTDRSTNLKGADCGQTAKEAKEAGGL